MTEHNEDEASDMVEGNETLDELNGKLDAQMAANEEYARTNQLGIGQAALTSAQMFVMVNELFPTIEDKIEFDIQVQNKIMQGMVDWVEEQKAADARARLMQGVSAQDIAKGRVDIGGIDLSAAPRSIRRAAERKEVKDRMKGN